MSIRNHSARPPFVRFVQCVLGLAFLLAPMLTLMAASDVRAQTTNTAIYGVTALDVAPGAASQGVALLKQYRDGALKQAGNTGVTLLQEVDWPNRFIVYETWQDQAAFDANEKAAPSAELAGKLKAMSAAPFDRRDYQVISVGKAHCGCQVPNYRSWREACGVPLQEVEEQFGRVGSRLLIREGSGIEYHRNPVVEGRQVAAAGGECAGQP